MNEIDFYRQKLSQGQISRREFTRRLSSLGVALPVIGTLLSTPGPIRAQTPKRGGRARLAFDQSRAADSLDPVKFLVSIDSGRGMTVYNTLVRITPTLTPEPELAESWESNPTADQWVFRMRKGVTFHDGKPLTAADAVYSISRHLGKDSKSPAKALLSGISEIKADGPSTLRLRLDSPNADLPLHLGITHSAIVQNGFTDFDNAVGTGPFRLKSFEPGVRTILTRNNNYWKSGLPYLDEVELFGIADTFARMNALLSGAADYIIQIDPKTTEPIKSNQAVELFAARGGAHWTFVMMRDMKPFDNVDAVLAMKYLLDRKLILNTVLNGHGQIGNDHPIAPFNPFYCHDIPVRPYDPERAKFHLKKAGLEKATLTLKTSTTVQGGLAPDAALLLQQSAEKAGVTIEVQNLPASGYWENVWIKTPFHMSSWNMRPTTDLMFSVAFLPNAPWNEAHWRSERFERLLLEARGTVDGAKRKQLYCEMQRMIHEDGGVGIPVFFDLLDAKRKALKGITPHPLSPMGAWRIAETLWIDA